MWKRIVAVLLLVPLLDALFLVVVADFLGWRLTVLLVVLTALLGMLFVRAEGRHTVRRFRDAIAAGRVPTDELLDGGFLLAAGAFLLTPGLVTDAIGFLLVFPPTRYGIRAVTKRWVVAPYLEKRTGGFVSGDVYTFGFPDAESRDERARSSPDGGENTVDLGSEDYDVRGENPPDDEPPGGSSPKRNP